MADDEPDPIVQWAREQYGGLDVAWPSIADLAFVLAQLALGFVFGAVLAGVWIVRAAERQYRGLPGETVVLGITASGVGDAVWPLVAVGAFAFVCGMGVVAWCEWRSGDST